VALEELGMPFELVRVDLAKHQQKTPALLSVNPNGKVPVLVDGEVRVFESLAIILYLGTRYGVDRGLWPKLGAPESGDALAWSVWASTELHRHLVEFVVHASDVKGAHPVENRSAYLADLARRRWTRCLEILEEKLEGRDFLLGRTYTLADIAVASPVHVGCLLPAAPRLDATISGLPAGGRNVCAWLERLHERPAYAKAMAEYYETR
jgi:glutathione S-transferase